MAQPLAGNGTTVRLSPDIISYITIYAIANITTYRHNRCDSSRPKILQGVRLLRLEEQGVRLGPQWFLVQCLQVSMHFILLQLLPILLLYLLNGAQWTYVKSTAPPLPARVLRRSDLNFSPFAFFDGEIVYLYPLKHLVITMLIVSGSLTVCLLHKYIASVFGCNAHNPKSIIGRRLLNGLLFSSRLLLGATMLTLICCLTFYSCLVLLWVLLAAFISPEEYLPLVTTAVVTLSVLSKMWSRLLALRADVEEETLYTFRKIVKQNMYATYKPGRARSVVTLKENEDDGVLDPSDVFSWLDTTSKGFLNAAQFFSLFERLGIHLPDSARTEIFASTDFSCDGKVSEKEFSDAWQIIELQILRRLGMTLGLSETEERVKIQIAWTHTPYPHADIHGCYNKYKPIHTYICHEDKRTHTHTHTHAHTHTHTHTLIGKDGSVWAPLRTDRNILHHLRRGVAGHERIQQRHTNCPHRWRCHFLQWSAV
jgi:hypothetical protein